VVTNINFIRYDALNYEYYTSVRDRETEATMVEHAPGNAELGGRGLRGGRADVAAMTGWIVLLALACTGLIAVAFALPGSW
jgi:hypothetical protein